MIFLRPFWLVLLIVPILFIWLRRKGNMQNPWQKYIDSALMPYLSVSSKIGGGRSRIQWLIAFVWCCFTFALAGPAFDKLPTPAVDESPATVLIVDLNTLNPEKTKLLQVKLYDLIRQLGDNQIGLVLYDTKGYIALPLTRDKEILNALIPSLETRVMPSVGNNVSKGFQKADELFRNTNQKTGRVLLITAGTPDITQAIPMIGQMPYKIGVLGIGDEKTGSPIITRNGSFLRDSQGNLVLSKPDEKVLSQLGAYRASTPNGTEIAELLKLTEPVNVPVLQTNMPDFMTAFVEADVWRDLGVYLVCVALPFLALLFRKGVFYVGFIALIISNTTSAEAGWWLRPDQESYRQIESGNAAYRQKDYQKALSIYEAETNPEALYNKANALAQMGQYQAAIDTYDYLLKQMPKHADAAYNKEYIEKQLQQQNKQNQTNNQKDNKENQNDQSNQENQQNQNDSNDQNNSQNQGETSDQSDLSEQNNEEQSHNSDDSQNNQSVSESKGQEDRKDESQNGSSHQKENEAESESSQGMQSDESENSSQSESNEIEKNLEDTSNQATQEESDLSDGEESMQNGFEEAEFMSDKIDQETQQIINRLKKDPSRVLRYRLYRQYQGN